MGRPLVSVVVPVYNHERFIEQALRSVLHQSYRPIELIVIDDGSFDASADLAAALVREAGSSAVFIRRENRGAHTTLNQGLALASGDYVTVLNSDDAYHPDRIARCVETARRTGRDFIFTEVDFIDDSGAIVLTGDPVDGIRRAERAATRYPTVGYALLKNQLAVTTGNFFFSRSLLGKLISFRHYRYVHDWDFILRAIFHTEPYFLRVPLHSYRLHDANTFKLLGNVAAYETTEVMRNALRLLTRRMPENPLAPCPHYWPGFFQWFIETWNYQVYMP